MDTSKQQESAEQIEFDLFAERLPALDTGSSPGSGVAEVFELSVARSEDRTATETLMEQVASRANLFRACRKVKANKGSAGVDRQTVHELPGWLETNWQELRESAVALVQERKFLGYRILPGGKLGIAPQSVAGSKRRFERSRNATGVVLWCKSCSN